jgi:hypothetical protein
MLDRFDKVVAHLVVCSRAKETSGSGIFHVGFFVSKPEDLVQDGLSVLIAVPVWIESVVMAMYLPLIYHGIQSPSVTVGALDA